MTKKQLQVEIARLNQDLTEMTGMYDVVHALVHKRNEEIEQLTKDKDLTAEFIKRTIKQRDEDFKVFEMKILKLKMLHATEEYKATKYEDMFWKAHKRLKEGDQRDLDIYEDDL
jgi:hypothetical protein